MFWPAAAGAVAFFMLESRIARFVLGGVMVLIGYRITLSDERLDAYRLGEYVRELAALRYSDFLLWVNQYCFHSERCIDPVQPFYTFLLTRFSSEPAVTFAGYALLFAILSIAFIGALHRDWKRDTLLFGYFFLFLIIAKNPIYDIGGFRFNTASWAFLLGIYLVYYRGRVFGFAFIFLAVCFHYAMAPIAILAVLLRFIRVSLRFALVLGLASFAISSSAQWLSPVLSIDYQLGALTRGARYISEGALEARAQALQQAYSSNLFFSVFSTTGIKFALGVWMGYLLFVKKLSGLGRREARFIIFALLFFAISNVFSDIPSFSRYNVISVQLLFASFVLTSNLYSNRERIGILVLFIPVTLFSMLITVRIGLGLVDLYSLLPSPFLLIQRHTLF